MSAVRACLEKIGARRVFGDREASGNAIAREIVFPAAATAVIIASANIRIPLGLPGHRGLVWLTLLVAVTSLTRRRETVLAVGGAATVATLLLQQPTVAAGSMRYSMAAVLLYGVAAVPAVSRRRWLIASAAAPTHLVAFVGSSVVLLRGDRLLAPVWNGLADKVVFHLIFGLVAGVLGLTLALSINRCCSPPPSGQTLQKTRRREYVS